jgi:hypothetical protein
MRHSVRRAPFLSTISCMPKTSGIPRKSSRMGENWRRGRDSNPWKPSGFNGFQDRRLQPLGHLSTVDFPYASITCGELQFTTRGLNSRGGDTAGGTDGDAHRDGDPHGQHHQMHDTQRARPERQTHADQRVAGDPLGGTVLAVTRAYPSQRCCPPVSRRDRGLATASFGPRSRRTCRRPIAPA